MASPAFTRRHYIAVVGVLQIVAAQVIRGELLHADETWREFRDTFADLFAEDNERFDRDRFIAAIDPASRAYMDGEDA